MPLFDDIEDQVRKMDQVMGDLDIRGKITEIDAKKKFHLIEDHRKGVDDGHPPGVPVAVKTPTKATLLKLFFGLVVGCGRKGKGICRGGAVAAVGAGSNRYNYNDAEFMDYEEDEKMMD